jgi:hypothetical protein
MTDFILIIRKVIVGIVVALVPIIMILAALWVTRTVLGG